MYIFTWSSPLRQALRKKANAKLSAVLEPTRARPSVAFSPPPPSCSDSLSGTLRSVNKKGSNLFIMPQPHWEKLDKILFEGFFARLNHNEDLKILLNGGYSALTNLEENINTIVKKITYFGIRTQFVILYLPSAVRSLRVQCTTRHYRTRGTILKAVRPTWWLYGLLYRQWKLERYPVYTVPGVY